MSRNPNRGRVYRRCACRDTTGGQLGAHCPELTNRRHGRWAFAVDLPTIDQQRRTMRRCGFLTQAHARAALHRVLACEQAGIHSDDRQTVAEYLNDWLDYKAAVHGLGPAGADAGRRDPDAGAAAVTSAPQVARLRSRS